MTDRSNPSHRPRYVQFRFQESLRKYQHPPQKFPKLNESVCKNCYRKSCDSGRESRLMRLCETRRLYHATSREKASEFSRKKQALQLSLDRVSNHVSDFSCTDNYPVISSQAENQISSASNLMSQLHLSTSKQNEVMHSEKKLNWSIKIRQTPIKQQVREQLKNMQGTPIKQLEQFQVNDVKVKDIEFHIGLVEELHQKINHYIRSQSKQRQQQITQSVQGMKEYESHPNQQWVNDMQQRIEVCQNRNQNNMQMQIEVRLCEEQIKPQTKQDNMREALTHPDRCLKSSKIEQAQKTNGRIQIKGEKGSCFLSTRILKKLLIKNHSTNSVNNTVTRLHPYLGDISQILQNLTLHTSLN